MNKALPGTDHNFHKFLLHQLKLIAENTLFVLQLIEDSERFCCIYGEMKFIQVSPSSGGLQLVDATGSIDVVIPDIPSNWDLKRVYEVMMSPQSSLASFLDFRFS